MTVVLNMENLIYFLPFFCIVCGEDFERNSNQKVCKECSKEYIKNHDRERKKRLIKNA